MDWLNVVAQRDARIAELEALLAEAAGLLAPACAECLRLLEEVSTSGTSYAGRKYDEVQLDRDLRLGIDAHLAEHREPESCPECWGRGWIPRYVTDSMSSTATTQPCPRCTPKADGMADARALP